ncbi:hypothetical protein J4G08_15310 [Candidatus Poribacteria bacterium]|nr:hypothetical protein [Candidatus Poribacteria bacterium]
MTFKLGIRRDVVPTPDLQKLTNQAGWGTQPLRIQLPILIVKVHKVEALSESRLLNET